MPRRRRRGASGGPRPTLFIIITIIIIIIIFIIIIIIIIIIPSDGCRGGAGAVLPAGVGQDSHGYRPLLRLRPPGARAHT